MDLVADGKINAVKLLTERIDLLLEEELATAYIFKKMGHDPRKILEKAYELDLILHGYLAFSKKSDPELVKQFKKALETMKADGRYNDIIKEYI